MLSRLLALPCNRLCRILVKISYVKSQSKPLLEQPRVLELIERGAQAGRLSYEEINDLLGDLSLDDADAEELFEALDERAVAVVDEPRPASAPKPKVAKKPKAKSAETCSRC